jgi:hypothetical protein
MSDPTAIYARQSDPHRKGYLATDDKSLSLQTQIDHSNKKTKELGGGRKTVVAVKSSPRRNRS